MEDIKYTESFLDKHQSNYQQLNTYAFSMAEYKLMD